MDISREQMGHNITSNSKAGFACLCAVLIFVFILGANAHAGNSDPDFKKSIEFFQQKNYAASRDLLNRLVNRSPGNALYWFNLGNAHFMLENYKKAESSFAQVEKLKSPLAPAAKLYRAKALRAQGLTARALDFLQALVTTPGLPATIAAAAERERADLLAESDLRRKNAALDFYNADRFEQALAEISTLKRPDDDALLLKGLILLSLNRASEANAVLNDLRVKPTADYQRRNVLRDLTDRIRREIDPSMTSWALAEILAGYDSNVYLDPGSDPREAGILKAVGAAGFRPWRGGAWSASAQARVEWDETLGLGDLKILSHALQASLHYDTISSQTQLSAIGDYDLWANEPMLLKSGLRARHKRYWEGYEINSEFGVMQTYAQDNEVGYLGGTSWDARLYAGKQTHAIYLEAGLEAQRQGLGDQQFSDGSRLPWGFSGWGPGFRLIWRYSDLWMVSAQANYRLREYFSPTFPDGHHRSDRETDLAAAVTRILGPRLSAYFSAALVNNVSTLGSSDVRNENYSVKTALIGILYDVR